MPPYQIRLMQRGDVIPVTEIDREAFPDLWPPVNYQHEIRGQLTHYLVACDTGVVATPVNQPEKALSGFVRQVKELLGNRQPTYYETPGQREPDIIGFIGFWVLADEAHVTGIAVRKGRRGQGIGERLLLEALDLARELKARKVTLEVRVSNPIAQQLYRKCGFVSRGIRANYYNNNDENALSMTIADLTLASLQQHLSRLKKDHHQRWGTVLHHGPR